MNVKINEKVDTEVEEDDSFKPLRQSPPEQNCLHLLHFL
jgi:hypothetical protein